jgi:hypothetical protein
MVVRRDVVRARAAVGCGASPEFAEEPEPIDPQMVPPPPWHHDVELLGRWEGIGSQSDGPSWTVAIEITSLGEGRCAEIAYPSSRCIGWWECEHASDGRRIDAVEHITEGDGTCVDGAHVQAALQRSGRRLVIFAQAKDVTAAAALIPTY